MAAFRVLASTVLLCTVTIVTLPHTGRTAPVAPERFLDDERQVLADIEKDIKDAHEMMEHLEKMKGDEIKLLKMGGKLHEAHELMKTMRAAEPGHDEKKVTPLKSTSSDDFADEISKALEEAGNDNAEKKKPNPAKPAAHQDYLYMAATVKPEALEKNLIPNADKLPDVELEKGFAERFYHFLQKMRREFGSDKAPAQIRKAATQDEIDMSELDAIADQPEKDNELEPKKLSPLATKYLADDCRLACCHESGCSDKQQIKCFADCIHYLRP